MFGNRQVAIARELTKIHEETIRGNLEDIGNQDRKWKGELTLVIEGSNEKKRKPWILVILINLRYLPKPVCFQSQWIYKKASLNFFAG